MASSCDLASDAADSPIHPQNLRSGPLVDAPAVYMTVYPGPVRRTNIYLTEAEQAALDARAAVEGSNRSDVLRSIVDRELNIAEEDDELDATLAAAAEQIAKRARSLSSHEPDLRIR